MDFKPIHFRMQRRQERQGTDLQCVSEHAVEWISGQPGSSSIGKKKTKQQKTLKCPSDPPHTALNPWLFRAEHCEAVALRPPFFLQHTHTCQQLRCLRELRRNRNTDIGSWIKSDRAHYVMLSADAQLKHLQASAHTLMERKPCVRCSPSKLIAAEDWKLIGCP